jgi:DNA repair exonuclease SbcCD ATPase subunit
MDRTDAWNDHERFEELCALAQARSLSIREQQDLERHLGRCDSCRDLYAEYALIGGEGMAYLSANSPLLEDAEQWNNRGVRRKLHASIRDEQTPKVVSMKIKAARSSFAPRFTKWGLGVASVAACITIMAALGAYHLGERKSLASQHPSPAMSLGQNGLAQAKRAYAELVSSQAAQLSSQTVQTSKLEQQIAAAQEELSRLRAASSVAQERVNELGNLNIGKDADIQKLTEERDKLATRLGEAEKAYQSLQVDFANLKADHNNSLLHTASLESAVKDLSSMTQDQERRLKDDEQYLTSDRDIRELMGARKLYIADVFDVDSISRTRKPFGRVFYTQNKSLVFYAFDLDHQSGVKNASVFQVWGQRDSETNGEAHPMNLGILYMDSESNRRWVLRSDDPKQLAEIDAVFVTVEPHGGSQKPTGKPLLYALLRKEANHP